jgi:hypothetical protein
MRKIHECRKDYDGWKKRIDRLKEVGEMLSVYSWPDMEKIVDIPAEIVGVQKLEWCTEETASINPSVYEGYPLGMPVNISELSKNEGLLQDDFMELIKGYDRSKPMAIIHFTNFRY